MEAVGLRHLGHSELDGRSEGLQVVGTGSRLFVAHLFSGGFTEVDVTDPRRPRFLSFTPSPAGSWSVHLQVQDDILLVAHGPDMWSRPAGFDPGRDLFERDEPFTAGVGIYDVAEPGRPRHVGFHDVGGAGVHRVWFTGGRHAIVSAFPPGFPEAILMVLDVSDPSSPFEVDRWWLPGMGPGEQELVSWAPHDRVSLHHATVADGWVYAAWRDGGVSMHPLSVSGSIGPATRIVWHTSLDRGCAAHTALKLAGLDILAVAEEGIESEGEPQDRAVVLFDISHPQTPARLATLPAPDVTPVPGARYGPHNLYEYRPAAWQDGTAVFTAHQGAGLRICRVDSKGQSTETGHFVPDPPSKLIDPRPARAMVPQTNDVFVRSDGILAVIDANAGLDLLELDGA